MPHDEIPDVACPHCGSMLAEVTDQLRTKEGHLEDLEKDLRIERSKVKRLRKEHNKNQELSPHYDAAVEVFEYWRKRLMPGAREFTGQRFDAVVARVAAGATVAELSEAIDGCAIAPPYRGKKTTELLSICRNERNVQMFRDFAQRAKGDVEGADETLMASYVESMTDGIITRLHELRGWTAEAIWHLGIGFDVRAGRVVFPTRDGLGKLVGLSRYQPNPDRRGSLPKLLAEGARELFPAPETISSPSLWLVEGESDAVALHSIGQPAVAVPGVATWKDGWAERFAGFDRVRVLFDCDEEGRKAAAARTGQVGAVTTAQLIDLDPARDDRYDVGDLVREQGGAALSELQRLSVGKAGVVAPIRSERPTDGLSPLERVCDRLEARDCTVKGSGLQREAVCPNHDDRHPSLSISQGDDSRVLLHCHAGCRPEEVLEALGLTWAEVFAA